MQSKCQNSHKESGMQLGKNGTILAFIFRFAISHVELRAKMCKNCYSRYKMRQNLTKIFDCPEFDNFPQSNEEITNNAVFTPIKL